MNYFFFYSTDLMKHLPHAGAGAGHRRQPPKQSKKTPLFSLYLASQLMYGTVLIYDKQHKYLLDKFFYILLYYVHLFFFFRRFETNYRQYQTAFDGWRIDRFGKSDRVRFYCKADFTEIYFFQA